MADENQTAPALPPASRARGLTGAAPRKVGFRADQTPYPGVDPVTGERKAVTYNGLREEFGTTEGVRLYNAIAVAGFGGVPPDRRPLDLVSLRAESARAGLDERRLELHGMRRERVAEILAAAEEARAQSA